MKLILLYLTLLAFASSCGGDAETIDDACAGNHADTWTGVIGTLTLTASCTFQYEGSTCVSQGTYSPVLGDSGTMAVNITTTTGECLAVGDHACEYVISDSDIAYDCGTGTFVYSR